MTYPKDPLGLRWDEHYLMADQIYAAYTKGTPPTVRQLPPDERRAYDRKARRNWAGRKLAGKRVA